MVLPKSQNAHKRFFNVQTHPMHHANARTHHLVELGGIREILLMCFVILESRSPEPSGRH